MSILGVPKEDEPRMLRLTQELFGGRDEDMIRNTDETSPGSNTITDFFEYFTNLTEEEENNLEMLLVLLQMQINDEPLGHVSDILLCNYCTAGHVPHHHLQLAVFWL